jgi:outer membrane protein assembly factor BamD (BamD/ComL family)
MKVAIVWICFLGSLAFVLGQSTLVVDYIQEKTVDVDPEREDAAKLLSQMGKYCYTLSNLTRAEQSYTRVVEKYPKSPFAAASLFMIGKIHEKRGHILQAKKTFRRMEVEFPLDEEYVAKAAEKIKELTKAY